MLLRQGSPSHLAINMIASKYEATIREIQERFLSCDVKELINTIQDKVIKSKIKRYEKNYPVVIDTKAN